MAADLWSVVVGGALTIGGGAAVKWLEFYRERKSLRAAFRAEIASIIRMDEIRNHTGAFEHAVSEWRAGRDFRYSINGGDRPADEAIPVFKNNVSKIGLIGASVAEDVIKFYGIYYGIWLDMSAYTSGKMDEWSRDGKIALVERDIALWREAIALGRDLVSRL